MNTLSTSFLILGIIIVSAFIPTNQVFATAITVTGPNGLVVPQSEANMNINVTFVNQTKAFLSNQSLTSEQGNAVVRVINEIIAEEDEELLEELGLEQTTEVEKEEVEEESSSSCSGGNDDSGGNLGDVCIEDKCVPQDETSGNDNDNGTDDNDDDGSESEEESEEHQQEKEEQQMLLIHRYHHHRFLFLLMLLLLLLPLKSMNV